MVTMAIIAISIRSIEMVPPCWWIYLFFSCTNYGFQCARIDQCDIAFLWNWNYTFFFPWYSHKWHDQNHFFCCVLFKVKHHAIVLDCSHEYVTYFLLLSDIILESFISIVFWLIFYFESITCGVCLFSVWISEFSWSSHPYIEIKAIEHQMPSVSERIFQKQTNY